MKQDDWKSKTKALIAFTAITYKILETNSSFHVK